MKLHEVAVGQTFSFVASPRVVFRITNKGAFWAQYERADVKDAPIIEKGHNHKAYNEDVALVAVTTDGNMTVDGAKLLAIAREEERGLLALRDSLESRRIVCADNPSHQYRRARLTAFIDALDAVKIDRSEFNWIFNI